jgi:hypothetical protein
MGKKGNRVLLGFAEEFLEELAGVACFQGYYEIIEHREDFLRVCEIE